MRRRGTRGSSITWCASSRRGAGAIRSGSGSTGPLRWRPPSAIHSLIWCAGFLRGTAGALPTLAEAIYEHAVVVANHRSYFSSANNHLIVELSALIVAALTLGGDLARLHAPALARLTKELDRQILPDGVDAEMATHYHVFVLEALAARRTPAARTCDAVAGPRSRSFAAWPTTSRDPL